MKIAITADPEIPVPPLHYGGIERIVDMLAHGLKERGHEVYLYANPASEAAVNLVPYKGLQSGAGFDTLKNMWQLGQINAEGFDLVHSFGRLAYLTPLLPRRLPKIMSYQREPTLSRIKWAARLSSKGSIHFTGCSNYITDQIRSVAPATTVYNGVPLKDFHFQAEVAADAPLVFLGRIEAIKGTHLAVDIARASGRRLIIAGNVPENGKPYFETKVRPFIDDRQIEYAGPVNDAEKNALLGSASAFLMPIQWNEPFGIVMAEALACGTPVIGLKRGAVPEVVTNGKNGFVCDNTDEMITAVRNIGQISRAECRRIAEERFSDRVIVERYEELYQKICRN